MDSDYRSDSDGYYTVLERGDNAIRVRNGGLAHEVAFSYESSEDDLETEVIVRARKMMRHCEPVVVRDDGIDFYYLLMQKPRS